ncbi:MAG: hypothetical protein ABIH82_00300 [Candidatus Woesearchaeota archaeon]
MAKKKVKFDPYNKRLDQFLTNLQIEQDKKAMIIDYVEKLTFETLQDKSKKQLRLNK